MTVKMAVAVWLPPIQKIYMAIRSRGKQGRRKIDGIVEPVTACKVLPPKVVVLKKIHVVSLDLSLFEKIFSSLACCNRCGHSSFLFAANRTAGSASPLSRPFMCPDMVLVRSR